MLRCLLALRQLCLFSRHILPGVIVLQALPNGTNSSLESCCIHVHRVKYVKRGSTKCGHRVGVAFGSGKRLLSDFV
ncbi:hypothetical protein R3P38DRAFT_1074073 [Favolaschia claudopus]|uniref:Secreted protein n=1 Tax=Favolaschia claudopus TaxID=2862362 RepID=A0AAW0BCT5_9AGAR